MAIDNQFGKGIGVAAGFDLGAQKPLDARIAVNTIAERDAHITENRAYEGMLVYVDETKKNYQLVNGAWVELLKAEQDRLDALEAMLNGEGEEGQAGGALGALQDAIDAVNERLNDNGDIENRISQNESDIDGLQGLVGHPVQAGEGEEEDVPATGLHLALDNAKAELDQAILDEKGRAEGQEAAIRQEMADAIGQHAVEGVEASGLRKEMDDAVAVEKARAELAEQGLQDAIDAINNADNGILAQAKAHVAEEIEKVNGAAESLEGRVDALEADAPVKQAAIEAAQTAANKAQGEVDAVELRVDELEAFVEGHSHEELQDEIDAVELRADALEAKVGHDIDGEQPATGLFLEVDEAKAAANAAQADVDAVEQRLDAEGGLVDRLEAVEEFKNAHSHADMEQDIADNAAAIETLNGDENTAGSVAKAVKDAVDAEATTRGNADDALSNRIAVFEANGTQDVAAKEARLAAAEEDIARLDGAVEVEGSVKKQIKDAIDEVNGAAEALEERVKANEDDIAEINNVIGVPAAEGVEATGMHKLVAEADANNLQAAKDYADQQITALVDSAPDAMNTLNELAQAINSNKGIYDAWVIEHNQAMAKQKEDLQKEIDDDVAAEASLREAADNALDGRLDVLEGEGEGSVKKALADAKAHAEAQDTALHTIISAEIDADVKVIADDLANQKDPAQEGSLAKQIADEVARATKAEEDLDARVDDLETFKNDHDHTAMEERLDALEEANAEGGAVANAIKAAQDATDAADAKAVAAQADVDAVEKRLDDEGGLVDRLEAAEAFVQGHSHETLQNEIDAAEGRLDALEAFEEAHDHSVMEQGIADNKAAIDAEVGKDGVQGNRDKAIAAALEDYSTTEEMKGIIGNVVSSLALAIEGDEVVLKLGGVDGIALTSVSLDIATDAEIDEIIAGLDTVEGEQ